MRLLPRVAKRYLDRVEVPPDGLEHNFGRRRVYWLENSIFKTPHFAVDQSRRRRVKSLEQLISASRAAVARKTRAIGRELLRTVMTLLLETGAALSVI